MEPQRLAAAKRAENNSTADRMMALYGAWLTERCDRGKAFSEKASALLDDFRNWSGTAVTPQKFGRLLTRSGFTSKKSSVYWYLGLRLK